MYNSAIMILVLYLQTTYGQGIPPGVTSVHMENMHVCEEEGPIMVENFAKKAIKAEYVCMEN